MMRTLIAAVSLLVALAGGSSAADLAKPSSSVILTVTGNIENTNSEGKAEFDRQMLEAIGVSRLQTSTPWTEGRPTFEGVAVADLLELVGADGSTVTAVALNDYKVDIPLADFHKYRVLLSMKMDGKTLRVRDKGPLWIVYPRDDHKELENVDMNQRWVWQLKELQIH